jgi:hypothetical protein
MKCHRPEGARRSSITLAGRQLLASRAVAPQLLERQQDFRDEVLACWQDDLAGLLGQGIGSQTIIELLRILAALAPFPAADRLVVAAAAHELSLGAIQGTATAGRAGNSGTRDRA